MEVRGTTCDFERHTFFLLEMEIWIERTNERRGRGAPRIFSSAEELHIAKFPRGEGGSRCPFECFYFCFAFPRDGHKMVLYPNKVTRVFAATAAAVCFLSLYPDSEAMVFF